MPKPVHGYHDISDKIWEKLEPHLPGRKGCWGGLAPDHRLFINAVFWIMRTGASWRDLSPGFGGWSNTPASYSWVRYKEFRKNYYKL